MSQQLDDLRDRLQQADAALAKEMLFPVGGDDYLAHLQRRVANLQTAVIRQEQLEQLPTYHSQKINYYYKGD